MNDPLTIIDLTWRLPGPLATYFLAKQGFRVIKFEDRVHRDPFLQWEWDPAFAAVYDAFQEPKDLRLIDFGDPLEVEGMHREIAGAAAVVMGLPPRVEEKLGLTEAMIAERHRGVCVTRLGFRRDSSESAHDLNTLAQSGLLRMHILDRTDDIIPPPFLPVTGIFFSYHIATTVVTTILHQRRSEEPIQNRCWLQDAVDQAQQAYYPATVQERTPATFLHNGRFPCYNIYRTADGGYMAMACVEPKFWSRFRQLSGLDELGDDDGLVDGARAITVKGIIRDRIATRTTAAWRALFAGEDVCVDLVDPEGGSRE